MMRSPLLALVPVFLAAVLPTAANAQALPTASRLGNLQAGAGLQYLHNDYGGRDAGPMVYVDFDFFRFFRLHGGLEAEARWGGQYNSVDIGENSYLVGPRLSLHRGRVTLYGKGLVGRGTIFYVSDTSTSSSFDLYALGGGVEYRVKEHFNIRLLDAEQQKWPRFDPHTLSPFALTAGVAYVIP